MNKRIRELWDQAVQPHTGDSWAEQTAFMERFAELIVSECMKLNHDHFNDEDSYSIDSLYRYHFGFKE